MTTGFDNPIIGGGGALVYPSIHSPNFSKGPPIVGWSIDKNGDVFISGTFSGSNFEISSDGAFFYSGTPAAGNLISSDTSSLGTDPHGNAYLVGQTSYSVEAGTAYACQLTGQGISVSTAASQAGPYTLLDFIAVSDSSGDMNIQVGGGLILDCYNGGTTKIPGPVQAESVTALVGGSPETWHNLGSPITGWTVAGRARYKMLADSGLVLVELQQIDLPGSPPTDTTAVWTAANGLPAGYRPADVTRCISSWKATSAIGNEAPAFEFETDGSIQVYGVGSTTISRMDGSYVLSTV